ncbi:MAG TPA: hypothetical protein HPP87_07020 [Planctomycetes bacterium]|nr:hypothetical protein [Planctomycetota bacterium]
MKKTRFVLFLVLVLSIALLSAVPGCRQKKAEANKTRDASRQIPDFRHREEPYDPCGGYNPEEAEYSAEEAPAYFADEDDMQQLPQESDDGELLVQPEDVEQGTAYDEYEEDAEEYEGQAEQYEQDYAEDNEDYEQDYAEDNEDYEQEYPDEGYGAESNEY